MSPYIEFNKLCSTRPYQVKAWFLLLFLFYKLSISLSHQLNSNYDTYRTPKPDFSYHLVCLNPAALLQSNASSFSDLPPSDQQQNQVPPYSFFNNQFCSDVGHNIEEEICRNFHFIWTLIINTINYFINTILIFRFFPVFLLRCFIEKKNAEFLCS